jgi:hypothetical protein
MLKAAGITTREFLKLAGVTALGVMGYKAAEMKRQYDWQEAEKEAVARAFENTSWAERAARATEINRERAKRRQEGQSGTTSFSGRTSIPEHRRSGDVSERTRTEVEKMMRMPGSTLANENRLLAISAGESLLIRELLGLPPDATIDAVADMSSAFFQEGMEEAAAAIFGSSDRNKPQGTFGGKHPGDSGFDAKARERFSLFLERRDEIETAVLKYSKLYDVPARRIYGLIGAEGSTSYKTKSDKGAIGIMQVMFETAKGAATYSQRHGGDLVINSREDLNDPDKNIHAGVVTYASMLGEIGQQGLAAVGYNGGMGHVYNGIHSLETVLPNQFLSDIRVGTDHRRWQASGINLVTLQNAGKKYNIDLINHKLGDQIGYAYRVEFYGNLLHDLYKTKEE